MKVHLITSKSDPDQVIDFLMKCQRGCDQGKGTIDPDSQARANMMPGWHPDGLLDLIFQQKRFDCDQGGYYISEPSSDEIWGYGCYRSEIYPDVMVTGVRLMSKARLSTNRIIGEHHAMLRKSWQTQGLHGEYCTFNTYNTHIMKKILRVNDPQNYRNAQVRGMNWYRSADHMLLNYTQSGPYLIRNTPQYILYNIYRPQYLTDFLNCMAKHQID